MNFIYNGYIITTKFHCKIPCESGCNEKLIYIFNFDIEISNDHLTNLESESFHKIHPFNP